MTEDEAEAVALVDLAWARMWLSAMKHACELRIRQGEVEEGEIETAEEDDEEKEGRLLGPLSGLSFASLGRPRQTQSSPSSLAGQSFDGARELFKRIGARRTSQGRLVLDGFVVHFEVIEVEVALYQQLALWEPTGTPARDAQAAHRADQAHDGAQREGLPSSSRASSTSRRSPPRCSRSSARCTRPTAAEAVQEARGPAVDRRMR